MSIFVAVKKYYLVMLIIERIFERRHGSYALFLDETIYHKSRSSVSKRIRFIKKFGFRYNRSIGCYFKSYDSSIADSDYFIHFVGI